MFRTVLTASLAFAVLTACGPPPAGAPASTASPAPAPETDADRFAGPIERAHGARAWRAQPALAAEIAVDFGGQVILEGKLTFATDMSRVRIDTADGSSARWDGATAWVTPASAKLPMARFHVLTWPYFALAPLKLRDPGAKLELLGEREIQGRGYDAARLSFEGNVGDTPDDWYVLYRDPDSSMLHAMAYIVTFGTTAEKAEAEPHAIVYSDFVDLAGAQVPTRFSFYMWSGAEGIHGDAIGGVTLRNAEFVTPPAGFYAVPDGSRQESMPKAAAD